MKMTRLIPPVLFLILLVALVPLGILHPETLVLRENEAMPWDVPLILGLAVLFWAFLHFRRRNAEIHTFRQPKALITDGPFRFSRNPMYVGFLLLLVGAAFFVNTWCALLAPLVFLMAARFWYIPFEENRMRATFGTAYDDYAWTTRRWI